MSLQKWNEKPEWWDALISKLEERLKYRDAVILNKEALKAYLLQVGAIDLADRGYRTTLAMTREALLRGQWLDGLKTTRVSKHSIKVRRG